MISLSCSTKKASIIFLQALLVAISIAASVACQKTHFTTSDVLTPTVASLRQTRASPTPTESLSPTLVQNDGGDVTISFACLGVLRSEYEDLVEDFQKDYPNVQVNIIEINNVVDYNSGSLLDRTRQIVSAADVACCWPPHPEATGLGLVRDLRPFIEGDPSFEREDFYPHMIETFQWDGGIWALPAWTDPFLIFYNRDAFDTAGIPYPHPGWTQADFLSASRQLTMRKNDVTMRYGFVNLVGPQGELAFVEGQAGRLADDSLMSAMPDLNTPPVVDAVRWYTDLSLKHGVMPNPLDLSFAPGEDDYRRVLRELVEHEKAAMWTGSSANWKNQSEQPNLGAVPFPAGQYPANPWYVNSYIMSNSTAHPQESWHWLRFLTHRRVVNDYGYGVSEVPARRSVAKESHYWERWDEKEAEVLRYAMEHASTLCWDESTAALSDAIQKVWAGETVEEALADAQRAALEAFEARQAARATSQPVIVAAPQTENAADVTNITFAPSDGSRSDYRELIAAFSAHHPGIEVLVISPDEAGSADCFIGSGVGSVAAPLNLEPLLEADTSFSLSDFYPRFLEALRRQGNLWGLPTYAQIKVVVYNKDLFDQAGVPYPKPGWTLNDFLTYAIDLTRGSGDDKLYGFLPLGGDINDLPVFVALHGANLWDETGIPQFDAPDVVTAVRWYGDLALTYGVMPIFSEDLPDPDPKAYETRRYLIDSGRVAMWTEFTGFSGSSPEGIRYGIAPMPQGEAKATQFLQRGLYISADTAHPKACWEWLKFASERLVSQHGVPARRSVVTSSEWQAQVGDEAAETYLASMEYINTLAVSGNTQSLHHFYTAFADILAGTDPKVALREAQHRTE